MEMEAIKDRERKESRIENYMEYGRLWIGPVSKVSRDRKVVGVCYQKAKKKKGRVHVIYIFFQVCASAGRNVRRIIRFIPFSLFL